MSGSPSALEYLLALFVRHWAANMTLAYQIDQSWPGFGYTAGGQDEMKTPDQAVSGREYLSWIALAAVYSVVAIAMVLSLPWIDLVCRYRNWP